MINNFITFDIEEWYYGNFQSGNFSTFENSKTNLENNVNKLIEICSKYNIKSTCFIVGKLAKKNRDIVKRLYNAGHEIASHSFFHKLIYQMSPEEFNKDLTLSCSVLEDITGEKIIGFRAPSWSVNKKIINWFYDILYENGIKYSSSVYPAKTYLFGVPDFPEKIHFPEISGKKKKVLEIPQSLITLFGKKIGFSGGFFLRLFPAWFINLHIINKNQANKNVFVYLHPHEIDKEKEGNLKLNFKEKTIFYFGRKSCEEKLNKILEKHRSSFITFKEYISSTFNNC